VLDALPEQVQALTIIGSHAVHERTRDLDLESTSTNDGDFGVTPEVASDAPSLSQALRDAGFRPLTEFSDELPDYHPGKTRWSSRPGLWGTGISDAGEPENEVDLLVPETLAGAKGRSAKTLPAHGKSMIGRVAGIELAVKERSLLPIRDYIDNSVRHAYVSRISGIICAKTYKISDRMNEAKQSRRANIPKDIVDMWRCMATSDSEDVRAEFERHFSDVKSGPAIRIGFQRFTSLLNDPQLVVILQNELALGGVTESYISGIFDRWRRVFNK